MFGLMMTTLDIKQHRVKSLCLEDIYSGLRYSRHVRKSLFWIKISFKDALDDQVISLKSIMWSWDIQVKTYISEFTGDLSYQISDGDNQYEDISIPIKNMHVSCVMLNSNIMMLILKASNLQKRGSVRARLLVSAWVTSVL